MKPPRLAAGLLAVALLAACATAPPPPDWQMDAKSSLERGLAAYLEGNQRLEALEFGRARAEVSRSGRADLLARVELTRCAAAVASLEFDGCPAFDRLAQDATPAEQAYADFLTGKATVAAVALLPAAYREVLATTKAGDAVGRITDPVSQLVAAGVLLRSDRADPAVFRQAIETASTQGWRRPLLAWLNLQVQRADSAGDVAEAGRLRRRIAVVLDSQKAGTAGR